VISDQKRLVVDDSLVVSYAAVVLTATDYSPFGVGLYGRSWSEGYRYGFNGQEMELELNGNTAILSAEFWIYDSRLGRRFQTDPVTVVSISTYACFYNAPIKYCDLNGDNPTEPEVSSSSNVQASATLSFTFGTSKRSSALSFSAGISAMANVKVSEFSAQLAVTLNYNFSHGGLGMPEGKSKPMTSGMNNLFLAGSGTLGYQSAPEISQNLFNSFSVSTLKNNSKYSLTYAPNLIFSSGGRNQQNASIAFRVGEVSAFVLEDSDSFGLTDSEDRWWTGSGGLSIDCRGLGNNGLTSININSDTYTGNSHNKDPLIDDYEDGGIGFFKNNYCWANQESFDPIGQPGFNRSLNMAQTKITITQSNGISYSIARTGPAHFFFQNIIHDALQFHHFKPATDRPNTLFTMTYGE